MASAQLVADERLARGGRVAFGEDQVEHAQHHFQAIGEQMRGWDVVGDAGILDLALGPHQPLRQRRHRDEEGRRNLRGGQATQRVQG